MRADLVIKNIGNLVTCKSNNKPKAGKDMNNIEVLKDSYIAIKDGIIIEVGLKDEYKNIINEYTHIEDAKGLLVTPGLIDSHTHLVHGGSRENELLKKLSGVSYLDILKQGGGILSTVKSTKECSFDELYYKAKKSLNKMLEFGVTTIEAKSGYGLDLDTEIKQMKVAKKLNENHPIDLVSTFLGAHAIPIKYKDNHKMFIDILVDEMMPIVKKLNLAEFCDVFCEEGVFTLEESEYILSKAKEMGYKLKIHADEIISLGGAQLAAKLNCISADHLMAASDKGLEMLGRKGVIATILPGTSFNLGKSYANARNMINLNLPIALASDYNPGSCPSENLQFIMQLGCLALKMTPNEVINSVTINAAYAIDREDEIGSIEVGKKADVVIFDSENIEYLLYHFGINHVYKVYKEGKLVVDRGEKIEFNRYDNI